MKIMLQVLCWCIVTVIGFAQSPSKTVQRYTESGLSGAMSFYDTSHYYYASFSETEMKGKNPSEGAWVSFEMCSYTPPDSAGSTTVNCVYANGPVPVDAIRGAGPMLALEVSDLAALPSPFSTWFVSCVDSSCHDGPLISPWPLRLLLEGIKYPQNKATTAITEERRGPDGSLWRHTERGTRTWSPAKGSGVAGAMVLPASTSATISNGSLVYHLIELLKHQ